MTNENKRNEKTIDSQIREKEEYLEEVKYVYKQDMDERNNKPRKSIYALTKLLENMYIIYIYLLILDVVYVSFVMVILMLFFLYKISELDKKIREGLQQNCQRFAVKIKKYVMFACFTSFMTLLYQSIRIISDIQYNRGYMNMISTSEPIPATTAETLGIGYTTLMYLDKLMMMALVVSTLMIVRKIFMVYFDIVLPLERRDYLFWLWMLPTTLVFFFVNFIFGLIAVGICLTCYYLLLKLTRRESDVKRLLLWSTSTVILFLVFCMYMRNVELGGTPQYSVIPALLSILRISISALSTTSLITLAYLIIWRIKSKREHFVEEFVVESHNAINFVVKKNKK